MENNMPILDKQESGRADNNSDNNQQRKGINKKLLIGIGVLAVVAGVSFYFKGLLVAATIDGGLVSRLSVIKQLEKQGGKSALDALITEKLIENEVKNKDIIISDDEITKEIKKIEAMITEQGGTLQEALVQKGMTEEDLKRQIKTQKEIEMILADKAQVTDEEVSKFILDNKVKLTKGKETEIKDQIIDQLRNQKLNQEATKWVADLKMQANINYYVNY